MCRQGGKHLRSAHQQALLDRAHSYLSAITAYQIAETNLPRSKRFGSDAIALDKVRFA